MTGGWQPIATAPKDGTRLLLCDSDDAGQIDIGYWSTSSWVATGGAWIIYENRSDTVELTPTHWQPLPDGNGRKWIMNKVAHYQKIVPIYGCIIKFDSA